MSANLREFVDSNVLVYAVDVSAGGRRNSAAALLSRLWETKVGCLSTQVLQEFHVVATRRIPDPISLDASLARIRDYSVWPVFVPVAADIAAAVELQRRYRWSFWDALIVHAALEMGCSILWSEDLHAGRRLRGLEIKNPFASA